MHAAAQVQDAAGAASAAASGPAAAPSAAASSGSSDPTFNLACPICLSTKLPLRNTQGRPTGSLSCPRCNRTFVSGDDTAHHPSACLCTELPIAHAAAASPQVPTPRRPPPSQASTPTYADLTLTSGIQQKAYQQSWWGGTTIFRSPLVSFVYERGWRQGFAWAGFPGADKEFELAMDYLQVREAGKKKACVCDRMRARSSAGGALVVGWGVRVVARSSGARRAHVTPGSTPGWKAESADGWCPLPCCPLPLLSPAARLRRDTGGHELRQRPLHPPLPQVQPLCGCGGGRF